MFRFPALLAALLVACVLPGAASAVVLTPTSSPLPGSTFQGGDGNQADPDGAGSLTDWQNHVASVTSTSDPNGLDIAFDGGDKETEPYHWGTHVETGGVNPNKANLFNAWTFVDPSTSDVFLNLAFQREAHTGNTFASFELNQRTDQWVNDVGNAIPCRINGDLIIAYNVESGGSPPNVDVIVYRWTSTSVDAGSGCGRTGTFTELNPQPYAQGALNGSDISNFLPGTVLNSSGKVPEGTWGEASLNLSGLLGSALGNACFNFGAIQMHTRSSTSIDSQLQDLMGPIPVLVRSCAINVVKSGPDTVHHGEEMTFTFDVTNVGNVPLGNIAVSDDKCPSGNVSAPVKTGGDQDSLLESLEHWVFTCKMPVPAHSSGEDNPIVNTVTATGTSGSNTVSDTDVHSTRILHPDVEIDKKVRRGSTGAFVDGPIEARRGETLEYQFTVTNPGDVQLSVTLTDARCDASPALQSGDTDGDGKLDTNETWVYTCSHVVQANDPDPFVNHACVVGEDGKGGKDEDCDDTTTDVFDPDIEIDKKVRRGSTGAFSDGPVHARRGDTLEYEFTVTNPGDIDLGVTFTDARCDSGTITGPGSTDTDGDGRLDTNETWIYNCSHVVQTNDPDPFTNHACVTGTDPLGGKDEDCDDTTTEIDEPGIAIDKKVRAKPGDPFVDGPIEAKTGDTLEYQFTVTNTGDVPLTVALNDPRCDSGTLSSPSGDSNSDGRLGLTETWTYTCTHLLAPGDADPFTNHACAVGTPPVGDTVEDCDDTTTDILKPKIEIDKKVSRSPSGPFVDGPIEARRSDTLYYQFTVDNTGDTALSVSLTDARCDAAPALQSGDTDGDSRLDTDETWIYTCSHVVQSNDDDPFENRACVVGTDATGQTTDDCDTTVTDLQDPGISIDKKLRAGSTGAFVDGPIDVHRGQAIEYQFEIGNTGDVPLDVLFSDPRCDSAATGPGSSDTDGDGRLDVTETWVLRCSHVVTPSDPNPLPNTATVTGTDSLGQTVSDQDSASASILEPGIEIDKKVSRSPSGPFVDGPIEAKRSDTLYYQFTVDNTGNTALSVSLTDARCDAAPALQSGDTDGDSRLDTDETWIYTCSHVVQSNDDDPFENRACVVGTDSTGDTEEDCDTTVTDLLDPAIHVEKTVRVGNGAFGETASAHVGDTLDYRFEVTNTGDVPLAVTLSDARCDAAPALQSGDADSDGKLDLSETWVYSCSHKLTSADLAAGAAFPNTATAEGTDPLGQTVTDDDDANASILDPRIKVDKLVRVGDTGPFTDSVEVEVGQTLTYQLTVTNVGNTPLGVALSDPRCDSSPEFKGGDANGDGLLDLSETWVFTCTHVVMATDADPLVNTATVVGTDLIGGQATDDDTATADVLPPVGGLEPEVIRSGTARLTARSGCVGRAFTARVTGRSIVRVVFRIDGRRVKTQTRPDANGRFTYRVNPRRYRNGAHRLDATVTFDRRTGTRAKRLRVTFLRCAQQPAPPRFTG